MTPLHYETKKLFYNNYLYKISIINQLSDLFRKKDLKFVKAEIDILFGKLENQAELTLVHYLRYRHISENDLLVAKKIWKYLINVKNNTEYKLRIQHPTMTFYTNDTDFIDGIASLVDDYCEIWKPNEDNIDILKNNKDIIIVNKPTEYELKATFVNQNISSLVNWIEQNPDKVKAGRTLMEVAKRSSYIEGLYIYVRDEKILQLISLMGIKFRKVEKLVYIQNLDK